MVLEWTPEEASSSLLQDRPLFAAASVNISREAWETQNHQTFPASVYWVLEDQGTGDLRKTCTSNLQLHVCYCSAIRDTDRPFSGTSEESLRDSELSDIFLLSTQGPRGRRFQCMKLVLVS